MTDTSTLPDGLFADDDGIARCTWCRSTPVYRNYHDTEWGYPVADDRRLFEKICLEGFQSGLSWLTILNKRDAFRRGFADFDIDALAQFGDADVARLVTDAGIVRHRGKIESTLNNARRALALRDACGSLAAYFWRWEPDPSTRPEHMTRAALRAISTSARIGGHVQGPEEARLEFCRAHHGLCVHAGDGPGQRPCRRMCHTAGRAGCRGTCDALRRRAERAAARVPARRHHGRRKRVLARTPAISRMDRPKDPADGPAPDGRSNFGIT